MKIVLASGSPRRKELLSNLIDKFDIIPSDFDESTIKNTEKSPIKMVKSLAFNKAKDVFDSLKNKEEDLVVIGADTIVYFNNVFLGKPINNQDAFNMLKALQGNTNYVYTGMCIFIKEKNNIQFKTCYSKSSVDFKSMTDTEIWDYIKTKEPLDKAGAYAIQGIGKKYVSSYTGNINAIIGLNIDKLKNLLISYNIL